MERIGDCNFSCLYNILYIPWKVHKSETLNSTEVKQCQFK